MKTDQAEVVKDNGRKLPKVPPKNSDSVHLIYSLYKSWQRLLSVHDGARTK